MALPGSPLDPRSQGTNGLIRDDATLVQDVDDVLTILAQASRVEAPPAEPYQIPPAQLVPHSEKQRGEIHKNYSKTYHMIRLRLTNCAAGVMSLLILCNLFCWNWSWPDRFNGFLEAEFLVWCLRISA
jgi:predicted Rossmann fold nucleotide-binding protein DprA/Smf involved in DNA uptake